MAALNNKNVTLGNKRMYNDIFINFELLCYDDSHEMSCMCRKSYSKNYGAFCHDVLYAK